MGPDPQATLQGKVVIWIYPQHIPSPATGHPRGPQHSACRGTLPLCIGKHHSSLNWGLYCSCIVSLHHSGGRCFIFCVSLPRFSRGIQGPTALLTRVPSVCKPVFQHACKTAGCLQSSHRHSQGLAGRRRVAFAALELQLGAWSRPMRVASLQPGSSGDEMQL